MLAQRLITAAVGIPIIVAVILLGGPPYAALAAVILSLAALELVSLLVPPAEGEARRPLWHPWPPGIAVVVAIALIVLGADNGYDEWSGALVAGAGIALLAAMLATEMRAALDQWLAVIAAVVYVGVLGSYFVLLRDLHDGEHFVLLAVLGTWATDTSAYAVGKMIGRRKLAPRISPGKTVEGTVGAMVGGFAAVLALTQVLDVHMSFTEGALLAGLLPPVAVLADLGESMIKRGAHVKDTSELVPGHGGFLDRLDSILFTVPLVYYFTVWVVFD